MKTSQILSTSAALALLALSAPAMAHTQVYNLVMSGAVEAPPNASLGTGNATITLDLDLVTMKIEATFSGLTGNTTNAHIHCCTAVAGAGTAGVATVTPTFTGFPSGVTAGSYVRTFDMAVAGSYNAAFITANGGTVSSALNALVAGFDSGSAYFNVHTSSFGGGEIRGFLVPVPEPATYAMMFAGLAAVGAIARRRRPS